MTKDSPAGYACNRLVGGCDRRQDVRRALGLAERLQKARSGSDGTCGLPKVARHTLRLIVPDESQPAEKSNEPVPSLPLRAFWERPRGLFSDVHAGAAMKPAAGSAGPASPD
jgi:hypothetical protein